MPNQTTSVIADKDAPKNEKISLLKALSTNLSTFPQDKAYAFLTTADLKKEAVAIDALAENATKKLVEAFIVDLKGKTVEEAKDSTPFELVKFIEEVVAKANKATEQTSDSEAEAEAKEGDAKTTKEVKPVTITLEMLQEALKLQEVPALTEDKEHTEAQLAAIKANDIAKKSFIDAYNKIVADNNAEKFQNLKIKAVNVLKYIGSSIGQAWGFALNAASLLALSVPMAVLGLRHVWSLVTTGKYSEAATKSYKEKAEIDGYANQLSAYFKAAFASASKTTTAPPKSIPKSSTEFQSEDETGKVLSDQTGPENKHQSTHTDGTSLDATGGEEETVGLNAI